MSTPCLVLYDFEPSTKEERKEHKELKRVSRLKALVERLDAIVRRKS